MFLLRVVSCLVVLFLAFVSATTENNAASDSYGQNQQKLVSDECIRCLCEQRTGCKNEEGQCKKVETYSDCGLFKMTRPYWIDANKPKVAGDNSNDEQAFQNCAKNYKCSSIAVQNYMQRYKKDCNGDGVIDCKDFAAIHMRGANACQDSTGTEVGKTVGKCERELKSKEKKKKQEKKRNGKTREQQDNKRNGKTREEQHEEDSQNEEHW